MYTHTYRERRWLFIHRVDRKRETQTQLVGQSVFFTCHGRLQLSFVCWFVRWIVAQGVLNIRNFFFHIFFLYFLFLFFENNMRGGGATRAAVVISSFSIPTPNPPLYSGNVLYVYLRIGCLCHYTFFFFFFFLCGSIISLLTCVLVCVCV
jgi:hypothetical protein